MSEILAKRLRDLRKEKGSLRQVSEGLEKILGQRVPISTYSSWESGKSKPKLEILPGIAKFYEVSIDYLLGLEKDPRISKDLQKSENSMDHFYGKDTTRSIGPEPKTLKLYDEVARILSSDSLTIDSEALPSSKKQHLLKEIYINKARILEKLNENAKAIENYYEALNLVNRIGGSDLEQAILLRRIGTAFWKLGQFSVAKDRFEQALRISRRINDLEGIAKNLNNIGLIHIETNNYTEALKCYQEALRLSEEIGDQNPRAKIHNLSILYRHLGEYEKALEYSERALKLARSMNDRFSEAITILEIGNIFQELGDYDKAIENYEISLNMNKAMQNKHGEASILTSLGHLYDSSGKSEKAQKLLEEALRIGQETSDSEGQAEALCHLGNSYRKLQQPQKACQIHQQALDQALQLQVTKLEIECRRNLGLDYLALGRSRDALDATNEALAAAIEIQRPDVIWNLYVERSKILEALGNPGGALQDLEQADQVTKNLLDKIKQQSLKESFLGRIRMTRLYEDLGRLRGGSSNSGAEKIT